MPPSQEWIRLLNKKAIGIDNADFGVVKGVDSGFVVTERGIKRRERLYLPKQCVQGYDNKEVIFRITEQEAAALYSTMKVLISGTRAT